MYSEYFAMVNPTHPMTRSNQMSEETPSDFNALNGNELEPNLGGITYLLRINVAGGANSEGADKYGDHVCQYSYLEFRRALVCLCSDLAAGAANGDLVSKILGIFSSNHNSTDKKILNCVPMQLKKYDDQ